MNRFNISYWNYYDNINNITNNCCESYNNKISSIFQKKPTFYKLLYELREEENYIINEHKRLINGLWDSKKKIWTL